MTLSSAGLRHTHVLDHITTENIFSRNKPMTSLTTSALAQPNGPCIEFWFDFGSTYSYISAMRIDRLVAESGVDIQWRPIMLGSIFRSLGWASSPFVLQKEKGAYVWVDMARQCAKYHIDWRQPSNFPRGSLLPARVALAAQQAPWAGDFVREIFQLNFAADQEIESRENVISVLKGLGLNADEWIERASSPDIKQRLKTQTEEARARGVFGAPTFFVDGEMYWGNDRLEDALAALASPAAHRSD